MSGIEKSVMSMEQFRENYKLICKDHHVEPQDNVLAQLKSHQLSSGRSGGCLNLSTLSLSTKTCAVLAKCLAVDRYYKDVKMADCMIGEDGIKCLAMGLSENVACVRLDLKGNNIKGAAVDALGKMLRDNKTMKSLCLEWNQACVVDTSFAAFCEGLGCNTALQQLDLRNNQVSHAGAQEIAGALRRNTALKSLDLRWNNIGITGGRALHNALQYNRTVTKLQLAGNNVPNDLMRAIDTTILHNQDHCHMTTEYAERTRALTREIRSVKHDRDNQLGNMIDQIGSQEEKMRKKDRSSTGRIKKLEDLLDERKAAFNALQSKLSMVESETALSEQRMHSLEAIVAKAKQDNADVAQHYQNELRRERDERALTENRLLRELQDANDRIAQLSNKVEDLERKLKQTTQQLYDAKEQSTTLQAELKLKSAQYDERLTSEKQRCRETVKDAETLKLKELTRLQQEANDAERTLRDKIQRLELGRVELEEELGRARNSVMQEKLNSEEHLTAAKNRIRAEEDQRRKQLEERLRVMMASRDELTSQCSQQTAQLGDLQSRNANLAIENETLKRRTEDLNVEVSGKSAEIMEAVSRVRTDLAHKISAADADRAAAQERTDHINSLEKQLSEQSSKHRGELSSRDAELAALQERIRGKEAELQRLRHEEQQRAAMLTAAVHNYCSGRSTPVTA